MKSDSPECAIHGLLTRTRHSAADDAVLRAMPQMEAAWRSAALNVLLERDRANAFARLIAQFDALDDDWKARLAQHALRLSPGIRMCIEGNEVATRVAAVALLRQARSCQVAYLLVDALCCGCTNTAEQAAIGLAELASAAPKSDEDRSQLIAALKRAVSGWNAHRREEVLLACATRAEYMLDHLDELAADTRKPVSRAVKRFVRETQSPEAAGLVLRGLAGRSLADVAAENFASTPQPAFIKRLLDETAKLTDGQLRSTGSRVRRIAWLDDPSIVGHLNPDRTVAAIRLIGACNVPAARKVQFLQSAQIEGNPRAAQCAVDLLAGLNSDDARRMLRTLAIRRGSQASDFARQALMPADSRSSAAQPARRKPPGANFKVINEFWQACDNLTRRDRSRIARALDELGPDFERFLQHNLARGSIVEQLRAIGIIGDAALLQRYELDVQRAARHPDPLLRAAAIEQLSRIDGPATRRIVRDALHDPDYRVQASAVETTERLDLRELAPQLRAKLDSPDNRVRANAIKALLRFGAFDVKKHALTMLNSNAAADRLSAVWVVEALQLDEFIDRLGQLASADPDARVRGRAAAALGRMRGIALEGFHRGQEALASCG